MRALLVALVLLVPVQLLAAETNMLRNAGFTQCTNPGQPDYWGTGAPEYVNNFYGNYRTHPASPVEGTDSLILRNQEGQPGWTVQSHLYRGLDPEAEHTLSVYLRAGGPDTPVTLGMGPATKSITVSDRWVRYVWTARPGVASWGYTVRFGIPKGTLWIAAPMWVKGSKPAEFALHPADAPPSLDTAEPAPAAPLPRVTVPLSAHHGLGTYLDPDAAPWTEAVALPPFVALYGGRPAAFQTQVRLVATARALHIAFDCLQPDMANMKVDPGVYPGECVELFIAPEGATGPYYHFAVNPDGATADEQGFDTSWNGEWLATTTKHADRWTALIDIPWDWLPIGSRTEEVWGMNFCRHAGAGAEEYSQWSQTEGGFHNPARFGLVTLPESIVAPRAMDLAWTGAWTEDNAWGLTVSITPGAKSAGRLTLAAAIRPPGGPQVAPPGPLLEASAACPAGEATEVRLGPIEGKPALGAYEAEVSVSRTACPPLVVRRLSRTVLQPTVATGRPGEPLRALLDRSYYTTEATARLRVWCTDPRAAYARVQVAESTHVTQFVRAGGAWVAEVPVPLEDVVLGETPVTVGALGTDGGALELGTRDTLIKLPDKPYGTKVDRFSGTFIVDGEPFIPYCMGIHSITAQLGRLQDIKDHGFNTVCAIFGGSSTEEGLQANRPAFRKFFDECRRLGLRIIWWNAGGDEYERIRDGLLGNIRAFADNDPILAWYILDEPEGWWESETRKESDLPTFKEAVSAADPYRPSFFNYYSWKPGYGGYGGLVASDVGSLDRYPIGRGDGMKAMDDITRIMAADCLPVGKPVNIWLQLYGYDDAVREPTPAEQRCQTYLCLIAGARSLMYFIYKPMGRAMWNSMLPLGREIETLTPILATPPPHRQVTADGDLIRFSHRYVDGKWYLICANRSASTVRVSFDLSALQVTGPARKLFEGGQVAVAAGRLEDTFAPLATRVYVMQGK